jgi:hypothetical protein
MSCKGKVEGGGQAGTKGQGGMILKTVGRKPWFKPGPNDPTEIVMSPARRGFRPASLDIGNRGHLFAVPARSRRSRRLTAFLVVCRFTNQCGH